MNLLQLAIFHGHLNIARELISMTDENGALFDINAIIGKSKKEIFVDQLLGNRLLHVAAQKNFNEIFLWLCELGAEKKVYDLNKLAPIDHVILNGNTALLTAYLQKTNISLAHIAYLEKNHPIPVASQILLNEYKQFRTRMNSLVNIEDPAEQLNLLKQIIQDNKKQFSLNLLHDLGNDPNLEYWYGLDEYCYGHLSVKLNKSALFLLLEQKNWVPQEKDAEGNTVLMNQVTEWGISSDNNKIIIPRLINAGIDINDKNKKNQTALSHAIKKQRHDHDIVKLLLSHGAVISMPDFESLISNVKTHQHNPCLVSHPYTYLTSWDEECITLLEMLLKHGVDLNNLCLIKDLALDILPEKQTAWTMLRCSQKISTPVEVRKLCVNYGADPNQPDDKGYPELLTAIENDWFDYAMLLIKKEADVNVTDNEHHNTPLHFAVIKCKPKFIELLIRAGAKQFPNDDNQTPLQLVKIIIDTINKELERYADSNAIVSNNRLGDYHKCLKYLQPRVDLAEIVSLVSFFNKRQSLSKNEDVIPKKLEVNKKIYRKTW